MLKFAAGIRIFAPNPTIPIAILAAGLSLSGCGLVGDSGGRTRALSITPSAATFGSVTVKTDATQTIKISNTGTGELKILNADITGNGFSLSGMSVPTKLAAGASATFNVAFKPMAAGSTKGSLSIKTNASESPATVNLSGTGVEESIKLTVNETSLSFGSVLLSGNETKEVKITNSGNANATITAVTVSGAGFSVSGGSGVTLAPNQSEIVTVNFNPKSKGSLSGTLTVSSNAQTINVALGGTGMPGGNHSVGLTWTASTSPVIGYFIYRRTGTTGAFSRVDSVVDSSTSFTDGNVVDGATYDYVVTAVSGQNVESSFSVEVSVTIPTS
ncbi:MAG: choice-of-anchor D domain-containing protein [Candidatus Acidiferrales bacterium]